MSIRHSGFIVLVAAGWALAGCAAKPPVVEAPPTKPAKTEKPATEITDPGQPDGGMRIGNMTELPKEREMRSTSPTAVNDPPGTSPVIVSPPPAGTSTPTP
ncbi:MAG: hypothetical protein K9N23_14025 [Akkermansiaceae bacterium]|nr:hypothetical protein [Akkermansiaceae bacterium]MCF7732802.1 hypothetical protein [Akkermansiaceae bacterium]